MPPALGISSNFDAIAAQVHTAPAPACVLACVIEMKNAVFTLTHSAEVCIYEQFSSSSGDRTKKILRALAIEAFNLR
jgi:hypothetical protein